MPTNKGLLPIRSFTSQDPPMRWVYLNVIIWISVLSFVLLCTALGQEPLVAAGLVATLAPITAGVARRIWSPSDGDAENHGVQP
ncbi:hypothetical protein [Kineosporia sp. R_H_3]|uniref:hypothetical protein n=1 Tax=Kineosporia sp. R_H_3 TaxID=1961848 RepID=UPI000B4ABF05|nr:hypothetical protein [Kineosporia sp. R_H_3]